MGPALAVGVPGWPHKAPSWDWLPLLGVILAAIVPIPTAAALLLVAFLPSVVRHLRVR